MVAALRESEQGSWDSDFRFPDLRPSCDHQTTMNLDSYTRLNPYSDEEKGENNEENKKSVFIATGISAAISLLVFLAWSRT